MSAQGNIRERNDYYPFGLRTDQSRAYPTFSDRYTVKVPRLNTNGLQTGYRSTAPYTLQYNGKELQLLANTTLIDYGARQYNPTLTRWTTQDPMAEKYYGISPYAYCAGNPISLVDVNGESASPIYSKSGNFLGTDNEGLQGKAIIMDEKDFEQSMDHLLALRRDIGIKGLSNEEALLNFANHYTTLPSRPDYDGYLTLKEANNWYRKGNGESLFLDINKINLDRLVFVEDQKQYNLFLVSNSINDYLVHGTISLNLTSKNIVTSTHDDYDFDMKDWDNPKNWIRNILTIIGGIVAGNGTPYRIFFYGENELNN